MDLCSTTCRCGVPKFKHKFYHRYANCLPKLISKACNAVYLCEILFYKISIKLQNSLGIIYLSYIFLLIPFTIIRLYLGFTLFFTISLFNKLPARNHAFPINFLYSGHLLSSIFYEFPHFFFLFFA